MCIIIQLKFNDLNLQVRAQDNVPVILVANKVDLEQNGQRRVSYEEGRSLANKVWALTLKAPAPDK